MLHLSSPHGCKFMLLRRGTPIVSPESPYVSEYCSTPIPEDVHADEASNGAGSGSHHSVR